MNDIFESSHKDLLPYFWWITLSHDIMSRWKIDVNNIEFY